MSLPKYESSKEELPSYTPSVQFMGIVMVMSEFITPYDNATSRKWRPIIMELNSTQLNFYELLKPEYKIFVKEYYNNLQLKELESKLDIKHTPHPTSQNEDIFTFSFLKNVFQQELPVINDDTKKDLLSNLNTFPELTTENLISTNKHSCLKLKGNLIKSYTLQRCQIGSARDFNQKEFVLRIRLEMEQLLIQTTNFKEFLNWYYKINIASNLALPIECRKDSNSIRTIPNRSSRSHSTSAPTTRRNRHQRPRASSDPSTMTSDISDSWLVQKMLLDDNDGDEQYLQLLYMSRLVRPLDFKQNMIGRSVVIYDLLPKIEGYVYNTRTLNLFHQTNYRSKDKFNNIDVKLVRNSYLWKYLGNLQKGRIEKRIGEEYLISQSGLIHPS